MYFSSNTTHKISSAVVVISQSIQGTLDHLIQITPRAKKGK